MIWVGHIGRCLLLNILDGIGNNSYESSMPGGARIGVADAVHHIMVRGIECKN